MTRVGRLAALDQQVGQPDSVGQVVHDSRDPPLRDLDRYRPLLSAAGIIVGWPILWAAAAAVIKAVGDRRRVRLKPDATEKPDATANPTFSQVFTIFVHASSVLAVRAVVAAPLNYIRES